jgi:Ca2+-binding EF-hand superfamily protein/DNA-binding transcriptional regulator YiaG
MLMASCDYDADG